MSPIAMVRPTSAMLPQCRAVHRAPPEKVAKRSACGGPVLAGQLLDDRQRLFHVFSRAQLRHEDVPHDALAVDDERGATRHQAQGALDPEELPDLALGVGKE